MKSHFHVTLGLLLCSMLCGCGECFVTIPPPKNVAHPGWAPNDATHSTPRDDWAPTKAPSDSTPSTVTGAEQEQSFSDGSGDLLTSLRRIRTSDGNICFLSNDHGYLSIAHSPDPDLGVNLKFGLTDPVGGTHIYDFGRKGRGIGITNVTALNSPTWDAHPIAFQKVVGGATITLLIFASDRPHAEDAGFSLPYDSILTASNQPVNNRGNADLYYAFGVDGVWSEVRNINTCAGAKINTPANDLSPFLFCGDLRPQLFFASKRAGDYNICRADLIIDWEVRAINVVDVKGLERTPTGDEAEVVNSFADDRDPFIPQPHQMASPSATYDLDFSSNRDIAARDIPGSGCERYRTIGGFDIYKTGITLECAPPPPPPPAQIRLNVVVLNFENPLEPVPQQYVTVREADGAAVPPRSGTSPFIFALKPGGVYSVSGGSNKDGIICVPGRSEDVRCYRDCRPVLKGHRTVEEEYFVADTVWTTRTREVTRRENVTDTILVDNINTMVEADSGCVIMKAEMSDGRFQVIRTCPRTWIEHIVGTWSRIGEARRIRKIRVPIMEPSDSCSIAGMTPAVSAQSPIIARVPDGVTELVLHDTVWVRPVIDHLPIRSWAFTDSTQLHRNVPYFQTALWLVNTAKELPTHLRRLNEGDLRDATWVELNFRNSYWGPQSGATEEQNEWRRLARTSRVQMYREYSSDVTENIEYMAASFHRYLMQQFEAFREDQGRVIIEINAFSDERDIRNGRYIGDDVRYTAAELDPAKGVVMTTPESIRNGASLVSADNDTLSRLRARYGFDEIWREIIRQADADPTLPFNTYRRNDQILLPTTSKEEYDAKLKTARIIFLVKGRLEDDSAATVRKYLPEDRRSRQVSCYRYDRVRRIDVTIGYLRTVDGRFVPPSCYTEPDVNNRKELEAILRSLRKK